MNKPGDFGGFHIVNIDDTIEINSKSLLDDINNKSLFHLISETNDEYNSKVNVYISHGDENHILFEIFINHGSMMMKHYHVFPNSINYLKKYYYDLIEIKESL